MELEEGEVDPSELFGPGEAAPAAPLAGAGMLAAPLPHGGDGMLSFAEVAAAATNTPLLPTLDLKPAPASAMPEPIPAQQQNLCRNFQRGMCHRGLLCRFVHSAPGPASAPLLPMPPAAVPASSMMPFSLDSQRGILPSAQAMDRVTADVASWQAALKDLEELLVRIEHRRSGRQLSESEQEVAWLAEQQRIMDDLRARNMVMTMTSQRDYLGRDRHLRSRGRPTSPARGRRDRTRSRSRSPVRRSPIGRRYRSRSRSRSRDRRRRTRSPSRSRSRSRSRDRLRHRRSRTPPRRRERSRTRSPVRLSRKSARSRSRSRSRPRTRSRSRSRSISRVSSRSITPVGDRRKGARSPAVEQVSSPEAARSDDEEARKARLLEDLRELDMAIARKRAEQAVK